MVGYCGSDMQQRQQLFAEAFLLRAVSTRGYCNGGRNIAVDEPEHLGWPAILAEIDARGVLVFRMLSAGQVAETERRMRDAGYRIDFYDTFISESAADAASIVAGGPPAGLRHVPTPDKGDDPLIVEAQAFMLANGIVPYSGSMLSGELTLSRTFILADESGAIAATAHTYRPHGTASPFHKYAWVGLVAVSPRQRGKSVGRYVNACAVAAAFDDLGAGAVYELVDASNTPSRKMVEACGVQFDPRFRSGAAVLGQQRFTR